MHVKQTRKESRRAKDFIWRYDNKNSEIQTKIDKDRKWKKVNIVDELLLNHFPRLLKCRDYFKLSFSFEKRFGFFYALLLSALFRKRIFKTCFIVNQSARLEASSGWREKMQPQSGSSSSNLLLWGLSLSPGGTSVFYLQYWPTGHLLSQQTVIKFRVWYIFFRNRRGKRRHY